VIQAWKNEYSTPYYGKLIVGVSVTIIEVQIIGYVAGLV